MEGLFREAEAVWRDLRDRTDLVGVPLMRLEADWKLARLAASRAEPGAADRLHRLTEEARALHYGALLGETL